MNEPVAVPVQQKPEGVIEQVVSSAHDEGQILDEGLDLSGYFGTHGKPYVADYFGLADLYKTNSDIAEMVDDVTREIIKKSDGQPLIYVAKDILDVHANELNLQETDSGIHKLKQTIKFIGMKNQAQALDEMKKRVLADIDNMV